MSSNNSEWLLWLFNVRAAEAVSAESLLAEAAALDIDVGRVRLAVCELVDQQVLEWLPGVPQWEPGASLQRVG